MAKDKNQDQYSELQFPLNGLYLATENETPPPNTTPVGSNVRTFETLTGRGRGGSRPGLKQYIPDQLIPGVKVQHLAVIIDPQAAGLFGGVGSDSTTDPARNLDGGSGGFPPVRHPDQAGRVNVVTDNTRPLLTITANNQTKTYGDTFTFAGTEFTLSGSIGILDSVDTVTLTSSGSAATAQVAGSPFSIRPSRPMGTGIHNYRFRFVNGSMTVDKALLSIAAIDQTKVALATGIYLMEPDVSDRKRYLVIGQDGSLLFDGPAFSADPDVLLNSDTVTSAELVCEGLEPSAAADLYDIQISEATGIGLNNYTITYIDGTLIVSDFIRLIGYVGLGNKFTSPVTGIGSRGTSGLIVPGEASLTLPQIQTLTIPNVKVGDLLVLAYGFDLLGGAPAYTVSDNLGNTYIKAVELIGSAIPAIPAISQPTAMWYCTSVAEGTCTVTFESLPSGFIHTIFTISCIGNLGVIFSAWRGVSDVLPLDSTSTQEGTSASPATGSVAVNLPQSLVLGFIKADMTSGFGYFQRTSGLISICSTGDGPVNLPGFGSVRHLVASFPVDAAVTIDGTITMAPSAYFVGIGASFKKA